jgi:multiple sugar transport system ATP-binding protein
MSGGQRQRVAVGRAIVRQPSVFLFDEPLSNLDAKLRVHMRVEITKLHQRLKTTMIYVTHDQVEAMTMGDRICVMELGKIKQVDTPINLYNRPQNKFVAGFIGSPSMNIIEAKITSEGETLFADLGDGMKLRLPAEKAEKVKGYVGKDVWFGIRPENIQSHSKHLEDKENFVRADVYVVEQMGNEVFVYFAVGQNQFIARLGADVNVKSGEKHELWFDMNECHVFDTETEENITL